VVFLYACSDEIHQLFVPNRSGELLDVLLDTFGGSLGVLSISFFKRGIE
jgi:VanZ family protein